jgi:hypothetical protein
MKRVPVALAAAACAAVTLAGCTDHSADEKTIRSVVDEFSADNGPRACDLLTHNAIRQVYGGTHPDRAHQQCVAASKRFTGAKIQITNLHWTNNTTVKVSAAAVPPTHHYTVTVVKFGRHWRIDGIVRQ